MVNLNDEIKLVDMTTRTIYLNTGISSEAVTEGVIAIMKINAYDDEQEARLKDYVRQPIKVVVDSYGGIVYDGMSVVNSLLTSKTPIHTYCYSKACSMGFMIMICGHKRFATKYSTLMAHQLSGGVGGTNADIQEGAARVDELNNMLMKIIVDRTKITKKQLKDLNKLKQDWFMFGKEALEMGVVDELIKDTH